jgi:LacI family transcriptional regulator
MTVGVVVPRLTDTVMAMLYEAIAHACRRMGRDAIVATTDDEPSSNRIAAETLLQRRVDGLVLATARMDDSFPQELTARGVPHVLALRTDGQSLSAVCDDKLGGYLATRHLLDLGHRRIGMIAGPGYVSTVRGRVAGYRDAMAEAGIDVHPAWVIESTFTMGSGEDAAERLMGVTPRPSAVFAANDNIAIGALSTFAKLGLSVPVDVSLVGYADIPVVSRLPVPLTSVRVPFDQIAAAALDLLESGPMGKSDRVRMATPTLIPRRSTAAPPSS